MHYQDRIYGSVEIAEPVAVALIESPALQRLKGIDQQGYFEPYFPGTAHNRFEHSVGVFLLLKKFGAPLEEQIAGLLHDVSHVVFSHCIDYVMREKIGNAHNQQHQDDIHADFIRKTEIPAILKKYGIPLDYILDDNNFPLKERPLPELCADRIDYVLQDATAIKYIGSKDVAYLLDHLTVSNRTWVFKDFASAKRYVDLFFRLNQEYYAGVPTILMFSTMAKYLRYALDKNYIHETDLYTTDAQVLAKIARHHADDKTLAELFNRANNKVPYTVNPPGKGMKVLCKSRVVDPFCYHNGKILHVSDIDTYWKKVLGSESKPKEYWIEFKA
ncbi:MAG: HD domain-containing protein [Patescibacteria group bacterium]|nr:HD domain-containing protein [Patescibacteria group bacterium]